MRCFLLLMIAEFEDTLYERILKAEEVYATWIKAFPVRGRGVTDSCGKSEVMTASKLRYGSRTDCCSECCLTIGTSPL